MAYPIQEYSMKVINLSGIITKTFSTCKDTAYLKFAYFQDNHHIYKICIPIFSKYAITIPNLKNIPIIVKLLSCTTKGSTRYSLLQINTIKEI